jgi:hypothetical protein
MAAASLLSLVKALENKKGYEFGGDWEILCGV